jgi:hypothetical protein
MGPLRTGICHDSRHRDDVDLRTIFVSGATGVLVIASIGYEKY